MPHFRILASLSLGASAALLSHLAFASPESAGNVSPAAAPEASLSREDMLAVREGKIADAIRGLIDSGLDKIVHDARQREALRQFYATRGFVPVWVRAGGPTERFHAAVERLKDADLDGLDASDYPTPEIVALGTEPGKLARAELSLMASLMSYARDAQSGRVEPARISPNIAVAPPVPEPSHVLDTLANAGDVAGALDAFNPPHRGFQALRAKLKELRGSTAQADRPGSGKGGGPDAKTIDAIVSNMERWRWLPRELGASHVLVNVPDFSLDVVRGERSVFRTRIVVGKKETPSPIFSDEIETVQVNPTWHVPESIVHGRYLPALSRDPDALRRMGLIVSRTRDGDITVRQPPGPRNALGRLKVNFPNAFHVYLHDTPDKHLFKREQRAYSAGCMRVQDPAQFTAQVLAIGLPEARYTAERLTSMYGPSERWITLEQRIPVHIVYMNAYVADNGKLVVRPDVYGYDARVRSALKGRYLVVKERSQRGSAVVRAAETSRSTTRRSSRLQPHHLSGRAVRHESRSAFGFWGWHPGY